MCNFWPRTPNFAEVSWLLWPGLLEPLPMASRQLNPALWTPQPQIQNHDVNKTERNLWCLRHRFSHCFTSSYVSRFVMPTACTSSLVAGWMERNRPTDRPVFCYLHATDSEHYLRRPAPSWNCFIIFRSISRLRRARHAKTSLCPRQVRDGAENAAAGLTAPTPRSALQSLSPVTSTAWRTRREKRRTEKIASPRTNLSLSIAICQRLSCGTFAQKFHSRLCW